MKHTTEVGGQNDSDKMLGQEGHKDTIRRLLWQIGNAQEPDDRLYYELGNAYRKKGEFAQALNCYLEAMAINPDGPATEAHRMLMSILEYYHKDYYNP